MMDGIVDYLRFFKLKYKYEAKITCLVDIERQWK